MDDLFDAAALDISPEPAGSSIIIADRIQRIGGTLPELTTETQDCIGEILPRISCAGNPVDTGRPMPEFDDEVTAVARRPKRPVRVYHPSQ